jgi:hypothetical protein
MKVVSGLLELEIGLSQMKTLPTELLKEIRKARLKEKILTKRRRARPKGQLKDLVFGPTQEIRRA